METLGYEGDPEAFHRGIIVTASLAAHAWADLGGEQKLAEALEAYWIPIIGPGGDHLLVDRFWPRTLCAIWR
jgi:hypothetical protein